MFIVDLLYLPSFPKNVNCRNKSQQGKNAAVDYVHGYPFCRGKPVVPPMKRRGEAVFVSQPQGNGDIDQTDRYIAKIAAAGVGVDDHKHPKGDQHNNVACEKENGILPAGFSVKKYSDQQNSGQNAQYHSKHKGDLAQNQKDVGQVCRVLLGKQGGVEHNDPGIVTCLCADGVEGKGKIPVGKCRDTQSAPQAVGVGVHGRGYPRNGNAGFFSKENQIADDPGQPYGGNDQRKNTLIFNPFQDEGLFPGADYRDKMHQEKDAQGNGEHCGIQFGDHSKANAQRQSHQACYIFIAQPF